MQAVSARICRPSTFYSWKSGPLCDTFCAPGIEAPPFIVTRRVGAVGKMNFMSGNLKADASIDRFLEGRRDSVSTSTCHQDST